MVTYLEQGGNSEVGRQPQSQAVELAVQVDKPQAEPNRAAEAPSSVVHLASIAEDTETFFY